MKLDYSEEWNIRLEKGEFINMVALSQDRGFNILPRISLLLRHHLTAWEKQWKTINEVKIQDIPYQSVEGGVEGSESWSC